ncbi:intraflagellar transport protein 172 homolog [Lutzomyia longipalpis]|uniref:intraflagellar transport protein 172 homolog n=1 Tax=Lutzomyia longipalpis TaxID=7200 RepID=UPI0024844862|nr:intraflagellar transport protein 172 homolog [Lutzomyia longipalpis]
MQLKFLKTVVEAQDKLNRVAALCWSANNQKLAIGTADRMILLFDEHGERRDKFSTKPSDPANGKASYVIRGLAFSPDSTRLAVAQSDCIVFVYKLGEGWNEKKVICNKFPQPVSVTCLVWLTCGTIVAGLEDGKVRALHSKSNKSQNMYAAESYTVSVVPNPRGTGVLSGHEDGSIVRFFVVEEFGDVSGRVVQHSVSPAALAWTITGFMAAGSDRKVTFYDDQGKPIRIFDFSRDDSEREFMIGASSPNGQTVAVGSFDRVRIYTWSSRQNTWNETAVKEIRNLYSVTALAWKRDGSRLTLGSLCGAVLTFESVLRRTVWQDKFELTFVAPSQILLKSLQDSSETLSIESDLGMEIDDVRIMGKDSYLVARTEESLILCDLTRGLTSEVAWTASGRHEKFYFENPNVCLVFNAGELSLIEYGDHYILGSVRTEFVNPHVISVRLNERGNSRDNKKLAYLLDMKTICVVDLVVQTTITQISHDSKIDWIELNETGHKLLFRDKKMRLMLVDIASSRKQTLLGKVSFVQWVIQSDVAVAQSDSNLVIWYNIDMPEHVTILPIRGEVLDVIREDGKTEVHTTEGATNHVYALDEGLVEFGTAVNDSDFGRAVLFLESLGDRPAATAMWHNLANIALREKNLRVAQRCFAALGNASKTFYLAEVIKIADKYEEEHQPGSGLECAEVQARLALLNADLRTAERIYLEQGDIESALDMYKKLGRWTDAIKLAERRGYHGLKELEEAQMAYLLNSGQEEEAGKVLEDRGDCDKAMTLYLKAKKPAKAARLALKRTYLLQNEELMSRVSASLVKSELYELAGDLAHKMDKADVALSMYKKAGAYARAIDLARYVAPDDVTNLEENWGDWLVSKRQMDASISHYIEAGATLKALEAAVAAKQWRKAVQIAKVLDDPVEIKKYALELSTHLANAGDISGAEGLLVRAELYKEAVEFLNKHGKWEEAYEIAEKYLDQQEAKKMFVDLSVKLEEEGKFKDAEKVLVAIEEPDLAIAMYKRLEHYDAMIRLVERYHRDLLENTHLHLARQLESKNRHKQAEVHFLAGGDWKSVVHMYCTANKWEDAYRVAKQKGGEGASNQVAFMWAKSLPIEGAARLLTKMGLLDSALQFSCEAGQFDFALELCRITGKSSEEIHLRMAMALEDEGKFHEAEKEFILAQKPREAILMYSHSGDWKSALQVAENYVPEAVNEVLTNQAAAALDARNYTEYEALMIRAERPDLVLQHYKEYGMWIDALRIAKEYLPAAVNEIQQLQQKEARASSSADSKALLARATEHARNEEFRKAADCLLEINASNADRVTEERAIIRAAEICNQFLEGSDAVEVARELGPRLVEHGQIGPAAQLYLAAEMPKEAVDVFIQSENWAKARRLAKEIDSQLVTYVEQQQKSRLKNDGNVEQLADIDINGALDLLAEQGQWTRCIEKAKQHSSPILQKYLALYAAQLIRDGDCTAALNLYLSHGVTANAQNFNIYNRIAVECLGLREPDGQSVWKNLRTFLHQLIQVLRATDGTEPDVLDRFDLLLLIAHYYATRAACRQVPALQSLGVRISTALLRYTEIIPVDKGFYEAGMDLRGMGRESEAFVILNHYLDVCEAIEEGSGNLVDHSDLAATDFPSSVPIPADLHLKNELQLHEEVREWVLAVSMDQRVDQSLPTDDRNLYESSLGLSDQPCIVSGYPVITRQPIIFQRSHRMANRDAWSKLTVAAKMAPHSDIPSLIEFVENWCGPANFISN